MKTYSHYVSVYASPLLNRGTLRINYGSRTATQPCFVQCNIFFESKLISTVAVSNGQFSQGIETKGGASCHGRRSVRLSRQAFGTV